MKSHYRGMENIQTAKVTFSIFTFAPPPVSGVKCGHLVDRLRNDIKCVWGFVSVFTVHC